MTVISDENALEWVEIAESNKDCPYLTLMLCESLVFEKKTRLRAIRFLFVTMTKRFSNRRNI